LEKNPEYNGIMNVITDIEGNLIYFTENGKITEDPNEGRLVYQAIRDVILEDGLLTLTNRSGFKYSLVSAEDIVAAEVKERIENIDPLGRSDAYIKDQIKKINKSQKDKLNRLYTLHVYVKNNPEKAVAIAAAVGVALGMVAGILAKKKK
jgi:ElaB/YqjD/DUF883 family membrane-anchored ribosome-binding protein